MTIQIYLYLTIAQTVLLAIVAIGALIRYRSRSLIVKLIGFVFLTGFLANMASWLMVGTALRIFVNSSYPISLIITVALYSRIYYDLLHKKNRRWFVLIACVFAVFALVNILFYSKDGTKLLYIFFSLRNHDYLLLVVLLCINAGLAFSIRASTTYVLVQLWPVGFSRRHIFLVFVSCLLGECPEK